MKKLYRAVSSPWNGQVKVYEIPIISETPRGYWVMGLEFNCRYGHRRWMDKHARKRYAWPTKVEALVSLVVRTKKAVEFKHQQVLNMRMRLVKAEEALADERLNPRLLPEGEAS